MNIHMLSPWRLSLLLALSCSSGTLHFGDTRDDGDSGSGAKGQAGAGVTTGGPSTPDGASTTDAAGPVPPDIDGQGGGGPICTAIQQHEPFVRLPIDLYFMFDRSGSMTVVDPGNTSTRMVAVRTALEAFLQAPASAWFGAGIAFFPFLASTEDGGEPLSSCEVADYARAIVEIGDLPANAQPIRDAIAASDPLGGTPTAPAVEGAVQYGTARMSAHPERTVAIVLVTDGEPTGCPGNTIVKASQVAAAAFAQTPRLRTFVLGVGPSTGNLDAIAAAGGTWKAFMATSSSADELSKALNSIRAQMTTSVSCTYPLPAALSTLDYEAATIATSVGAAGAPRVGNRITNYSDCEGMADGWYFDDIAQPTSVTLCPAACEPLAQENGSSISIDVPCKAPASLP
jgi:hypothetical protein